MFASKGKTSLLQTGKFHLEVQNPNDTFAELSEKYSKGFIQRPSLCVAIGGFCSILFFFFVFFFCIVVVMTGF